MTKIYGASVLAHANFWLNLRAPEERGRFENIEWTAKWPLLCAQGIADSPTNSKLYWQYDMNDITQAELLMLYAAPKDNLRGALVEGGIALGQGKPVLLVGSNPGFGTWQYFPMVFKVDSLDEAAEWIKLFSFRNGFLR